jgi:hypothetical protein
MRCALFIALIKLVALYLWETEVEIRGTLTCYHRGLVQSAPIEPDARPNANSGYHGRASMIEVTNPTSWLTARRVRVHGLLLAVCLWTVFAVDLATPGLRDRNGLFKGTDFLHFYTIGTIALNDRGELLYDMQAQAALAQKLVREAAGSFYVPLYGPQVSLFFAPFALLPYGWALAAWLSFNIIIYSVCCYRIWKTCPGLQDRGWTVLILAAAFPGFFHLLAWGQTSGLALACFSLAYVALRLDRRFLAGLAIGSLIFKPQLGLAAAVVFVLAREWKIIAGAILAALVQLFAGWLHYGTQIMQDYWRALIHVREVLPLLEPRPYQMHSLLAFWALLLPWSLAFLLYAASATVILALTLRCWKSKAPLPLRYSALLLATVLVAPHLTVYDLVILAPAFLLLSDWAVGHSRERFVPAVRMLLYLSYPLFLLASLVRITHVQLSVIVMAGLVWIIWQISCEDTAMAQEIPQGE